MIPISILFQELQKKTIAKFSFQSKVPNVKKKQKGFSNQFFY